jgi:beta-lactamase regulating signal transducer with metallopeptidase domain
LARRNSGTRFAVWFCVLLTIAALPWLGFERLSAASRTSSWTLVLPASWAVYAFLLWMAASGVALLRLGLGLWRLRRIRLGCSVLDPASLDPRVRDTWRRFSAPRSVLLLQSNEVRTPAALGFFRPAIVLPVWSLNELGPERLSAVLVHELAHVRRWDDWTNLAQKMLRALLFFHPAVWWIDRQLSLEREMACDDVVLETSNPQSYAQALVAVAERSFVQRGYALAQAAVSRMHQTSQRIARILDGRRPRATAIWAPAPIALALLLAVGVLSRSETRALIEFEPESQAAIVPPVHGIAPQLASLSTPLMNQTRELTGGEKNVAGSSLVHFTKGSQAGSVVFQAVSGRSRRAHSLGLRRAQLTLPSDLRSSTALLVVLRTQADGAFGAPRWMLCVWRVRILQVDFVAVRNPDNGSTISLIKI